MTNANSRELRVQLISSRKLLEMSSTTNNKPRPTGPSGPTGATGPQGLSGLSGATVSVLRSLSFAVV